MGRKQVNTPKKRQQRVSVTLHFIRGEDDEFIKTIEAMPRGDRSYNLKKAVLNRLPEIVALQPNYAASLEDITARVHWLQEAVYALPTGIEEMIAKLSLRPMGAIPPPHDVRTDTASQEDLDRRDKRMKKNAWG